MRPSVTAASARADRVAIDWRQRLVGSTAAGTSGARRRFKENVRMSVDNLLGGLVALALLAYLVYALIRPEKF
jgi:K+-transporting ATPase KdpF subunit